MGSKFVRPFFAVRARGALKERPYRRTLTTTFPPLRLLALLSAVLLLAFATAGAVVWRRQRHQRYYLGVAHRIRERFPHLDGPLTGDAVPLRSPPGAVAVRPDGILVRLDAGGAGHVRVPWSDIQHVLPKGNGDVRVHISGVGDLSVSGVASRQIWAVMNEARTAQGGASLAGA